MEVHVQVINNSNDMQKLLRDYDEHPPLAAAFDTESTGLSILEDKPFLFQCGWYDGVDIHVGVAALPEQISWLKLWHDKVQSAPVYLAHNVKFDLHMLANIGCPYTGDNISDTMFYIRFAHDNISQRQGGIGLGLKDYCTKYIDPTARDHDKLIQSERMQIAKAYNLKLKNMLGWSLKQVDEFFSDPTNLAEDFPTIQDYANYIKWKETLPKEFKNVNGKLTTNDIPYTAVNRDTLIKYAILDVVWVLKIWIQTEPVIKARGTEEGLRRENECIRPLWEMERQGFTIDKEYVTYSFHKMRWYIRQRRQDLKDWTGQDITVNQNAALLRFFKMTDLNINSTGAEVLSRVHKDYPDYKYQNVVDLVLELRTLEKWFSTYLMRFLNKDKIHTQINQVGAASLRMSSDFQQFPKAGITTPEGEELFNPRRAVKVPDTADAIVYLDYSQIELRVQALYTILVGQPDLHLCRAYMPYKCRSDVGLFEFDYTKADHRKHWNTGEWVQLEDMKPWVPTDVHGATTKAAFNITEEHPDYHALRYLGKRVNFAKNYGAQRGKIAEMFPDYDDATITAIDQGYYKAFPGIKHYQQYCYDLANIQPYATNLFGVRYWNVSGHNLINMLIQGSSATLLKEKIVEMHKLLQGKKSKMLMPIHDEVQFIMYEDEFYLIPQLKAIMEDWDAYVPIVADAEITRTYWSDKEEYNG
jgi:DNA polymerase-1